MEKHDSPFTQTLKAMYGRKNQLVNVCVGANKGMHGANTGIGPALEYHMGSMVRLMASALPYIRVSHGKHGATNGIGPALARRFPLEQSTMEAACG